MLKYFFVFLMFVFSANATEVVWIAKHAPEIQEVSNLPENEKVRTLCTALAVYHESRSERHEDQALIASLIYTREEWRDMDACSVVNQPYQFPWAPKQIRLIYPKETDAWYNAQKVALEEKEKHAYVEYVVSTGAYKGTKNTKIVKKTKRLIFYNLGHHVKPGKLDMSWVNDLYDTP